MISVGLETLLDLDGHVLVQDHGCWVKIEARVVEVDENRPHGIKYSLTLHAPDGERLLGYDNAHGLPGRGERQAPGKLPYDHCHGYGRLQPTRYEYSSPEALLKDFFAEVDRVLREVFQP